MSDVDFLVTEPVDGQVLQYDATLSKWINVTKDHLTVPFVNVLRYGADPSGHADSTPAIQAAINSLPVQGGTVYIPPGNYRLLTAITIGNGTAEVMSTRSGIVLTGGAPAGVQVWSQPINPNGVVAQGTTRLFTPNPIVMINVLGPLQGWGLHNLHLDGQEVGRAGIDEISAVGGVCSDMVITRFTMFGQRCRSYPSGTGVFAKIGANHTRNRYANYSFKVPPIHNAKAVLITGNGTTQTTDAWGNTWDKVSISYSGPPIDGVTVHGFYLQGCDSILVRDLFMGPGGACTGTGKFYGIVFDYANEWQRHPAGCVFDTVDFNTARQTTGVHPVANIGTPPVPGVGQANRIYNVCQINGEARNPGLPNLVWEHQWPKLSVAVTSTTMKLGVRQCQHRIMEFTGALTGNTNVIVELDSGHEYLIKNGTSGAFTLTIKGATGTGVGVGQGKRALLYSDGTAIVRMTADS